MKKTNKLVAHGGVTVSYRLLGWRCCGSGIIRVTQPSGRIKLPPTFAPTPVLPI